MGCGGSSAPEDILDPPGDGECAFIVKKPMMSSNYQVLTGGDEKKKWLQIVNNSSWFDSHSTFQLKTLKDESLVRVTVEGQDADMKKEVDWEGDSDDSDFSVDDLFDFDDDDQSCKVKLKWKVKREATFMDKDGQQFAKLKVKVKGKSKAELTQKEEDAPKQMESSVKVKKVYYKLEMGDQEVELNVDNSHWGDWDRKWSCDFFDIEYDAKWGTDEVRVQSKGACNGSNALAVSFALAYFFHPSAYAGQMKSRAESDARSYFDAAS